MNKNDKKMKVAIAKYLDEAIGSWSEDGGKIDEAAKHLGVVGVLLSAHKTAPKGQTVFWNGNIFDSGAKKIWFGDINLTKSAIKLQKLANSLKERIFVTTESPYRSVAPTVEGLVVASGAEFGNGFVNVFIFDPEVE